jgi:hypothetical protein
MRTKNIGGCVVTYPDYLTYEGDNNIVMLTAGDSQLTILDVTVGNRRATYSSNGTEVAVEIGSMLTANGVYGSVSVEIYVSRSNPAFSTVFTEDFCFLRGRTMPKRYHGSGRRIIVPYGVRTVEIPVMAEARVSNGSTYIDVDKATLTEVQVTAATKQISVKYQEPMYFGNIDNVEQVSEVLFEVVMMDCVGDDEIAIGWHDTDGCTRFAVGRILARRQSSEGIEYRHGDDIVKSHARRHVVSVSEVLEVGIKGVTSDMYLGEMTMSENVWILAQNGDTVPVVVDGEIETDKRRATDITLRLKTLI